MMDFKKFKKIASDKHSTTLKHADGHEFKVVHSGLSPKLRKEVEHIPMEAGGEIKDPRETIDEKIIKSPPKHPDEYKMDKYDPTGTDYSEYAKRPQMLAEGKEVKKPAPKPEQQPQQPQDSEAKKVQDSFNKSLGFANGGMAGPWTQYFPVDQQPYLIPTPQQNLKDIGIPMSHPGSQLGTRGVPVSEELKHPEIFPTVPESAPTGLAAPSVPPPAAEPSFDMQGNPDRGGDLTVMSSPPKQNPELAKIDQLTQADQTMTPRMQGAIQQNIDQQQQIAQNFMNRKSQLDSEHAALSHDILNKHIDMSNYWKSNDKGAAAIGAFLGGLGAGLTHQANPVPGMIAQSQDNFLKSEMANMENPRSLLSALQAQYGDNRDAADMLKIISNETLGHKLNQISAPLTNANAQANAANLQLELYKNSEALKQGIATRQTLSSGAGQVDPAQYVSSVVPKERQKEVFEEIKSAQNAKKSESNIMDLFEKMDQENTAAGRGSHFGFAPASVSAYRALILPIVRDQEGRVNEFELNTLKDLEPEPFDSPSKVKEKRIALQQFLQNKQSAPTAKGFGIDLNKFESTSQRPSVETATMNGKQYRKVSGGWVPAQ